jgi:hypothetical protein
VSPRLAGYGPTGQPRGYALAKAASIDLPIDGNSEENAAFEFSNGKRAWDRVITRSLHDALEETLGFIQRALDRIRTGQGADAELHNIRAYLLNILEARRALSRDRSRFG